MRAAAKTAMETALTERAGALSGDRAKAFAAFAASGMPHRRMEAWKWTDLRAALRDDLPSAAEQEVIAPSLFGGVRPFEITVMNGLAETFGAPPAGVALSRGDGAAQLSTLAADHPLANLCAAFARETVSVEISGAVAQPILIRRIAGRGTTHGRIRIALSDGAAASIIESFDGAGAFFSNSVTEIRVGARGRLSRWAIQEGDGVGVETALTAVTLDAESVYEQTMLSLGGKAARLETRLTHQGRNARARLDSAIATDDARHADATSLVRHDSVGCTTRQTHRSALAGRSRGVFQGKFYVARGAQKTDAEMNVGALLLSANAEANHKPELEIYADDVKCSHGSTAGALEADAIFYMRQRGLDERAARALLVEAFLGEIFDSIAHPGVARVFRERFARWLEAA
jgi:Fe-S cluster assembly protein SufD